jgi:hypothetical protein
MGPERFSPAQKGALGIEILEAYVRVRWWLWRSDLPRTVAAARTVRPEASGSLPENPVLGTRLGRAVARTLRVLPTDSRCLMQSLVLTRLLASRGVDSTLVIGVAVEPEFAAHAWVESGDVPLLPTNGSAYARLVRL